MAGKRIKASCIEVKIEIIFQKSWVLAVIIAKEKVQESSAEEKLAGGSGPCE